MLDSEQDSDLRIVRPSSLAAWTHWHSPAFRRLAAGALTILIVITVAVAVIIVGGGPGSSSSPSRSTWNKNDGMLPLVSTTAAVASDSALCSQIGSDIMQRHGGNAVDSAVAATLCLGVVQNFASGIGGGAFMIVYMNQSAVVIDGRDRAPAAAHPDLYMQPDPLTGVVPSPVYGGAAVAVPGELAALGEAHRRFGRLPWASVVAPAQNLAANGFAVSPLLAKRLVQSQADIMQNDGLRQEFAPNGVLAKEGQILVRKALGDTLAAIAAQGVAAFYTGDIATRLTKCVQSNGGIWSSSDLSDYTPLVKEPLRSWYRGYEVLGVPPASSGGATIALILNILERYNLDNVFQSGDIGLATHYVVEAFKHGFAHRMGLADPAFQNISSLVDVMLSKLHASDLRRRIFASTTFPSDYYLQGLGKYGVPQNKGTSHLSVVDADRNAVVLTSSVNYGFGSKLLCSEVGVVMNNQMDDFSTTNKTNGFGLVPSPANKVQALKRPLSSMSPTLVLEDGRVRLALGASGGPTIITAVVEVMLSIMDNFQNPKAAVEQWRYHHQLFPNQVVVEKGFPQDLWNALTARGHVVSNQGTMLADGQLAGNVQAILVSDDMKTLESASDSRKLGAPAGF